MQLAQHALLDLPAILSAQLFAAFLKSDMMDLSVIDPSKNADDARCIRDPPPVPVVKPHEDEDVTRQQWDSPVDLSSSQDNGFADHGDVDAEPMLCQFNGNIVL